MRAKDLEYGKIYVYNRLQGEPCYTRHWVSGFEPDTSHDARALSKVGIRWVRLANDTLLRHVRDCEMRSYRCYGNLRSAKFYQVLSGEYAGREVAIYGHYGVEAAPRNQFTYKHEATALEMDIEAWKQRIVDLEAMIESHKQAIDKTESKIVQLRAYASEEEALAALFSKMLQSGGEQSEILKLLRAHVGSNKL